jgi:Ca2+-binding EF-hand superfamily protein
MNHGELETSRPAQRPPGLDGFVDLDEQFRACDRDGDQRIDFGEFTDLLARLGSLTSPRRRRARFEVIDTDRDGIISRGEFIEWLRQS